jgi:hypothetical protein
MSEPLSAENALAEAVVQRIRNNASFIQSCERGTGPNGVKFDVLPAVLIWYHTTNYPDANNSQASGGSGGSSVSNGTMWISEWPLLGAIAFGNNQEEALKAMEEYKMLTSGFMPEFDNRRIMYPLHPVHFAVPFELDGAQCVGIFHEAEWQYQAPVTN